MVSTECFFYGVHQISGNIDSGDTQIGTGNYAADNGELVLQMTSPYRLDAGNSEFIVSYDF